jgi:nicotinamidase-related amidase
MDVLLIIDMQEASFSQATRFDAAGMVQRINRLSAMVRGALDRVVFIQHAGTQEDGHLPNSDGWQLLSSLDRLEEDLVIHKTSCDAFYRSDLGATLDELGVERLLVTGCATDFCVDTTIRSAVSHDINVVAVSDCHTTADRAHLGAEQIIEHHNWVWRGLIAPKSWVRVEPSSKFLRQ